jgi:hypothetical protein
MVEDDYGWEPLTRNVDLGGGPYAFFTEALAVRGVQNIVYDPYAQSAEHNEMVAAELDHNPADTATIADVLNTILDRGDRLHILRKARKWVKTGGRVYITIHEGDGSRFLRQAGARCQLNMPASFYLKDIRKVFPQTSKKSGLITAEVA